MDSKAQQAAPAEEGVVFQTKDGPARVKVGDLLSPRAPTYIEAKFEVISVLPHQIAAKRVHPRTTAEVGLWDRFGTCTAGGFFPLDLAAVAREQAPVSAVIKTPWGDVTVHEGDIVRTVGQGDFKITRRHTKARPAGGYVIAGELQPVRPGNHWQGWFAHGGVNCDATPSSFGHDLDLKWLALAKGLKVVEPKVPLRSWGHYNPDTGRDVYATELPGITNTAERDKLLRAIVSYFGPAQGTITKGVLTTLTDFAYALDKRVS